MQDKATRRCFSGLHQGYLGTNKIVLELQTLMPKDATRQTQEAVRTSVRASARTAAHTSTGGAPEWNLMSASKREGQQSDQGRAHPNAIIYQCSCPNVKSGLRHQGMGLRTLRTHDGIRKLVLSPLAKREAQDYLCHTWLLDNDREKLLLGCLTGAVWDLLLCSTHALCPDATRCTSIQELPNTIC
jgi:hypothetical protein